VLLESRYGVSRIATLKRHWQNLEFSQYGAVIFSRSDDAAINSLADLKGRSLMVVNNNAFGGFQMAWRELKRVGIDPFSDLQRLDYNGFPQDNIVHAVLAGEVDAGTVRTGLLENLAARGDINLDSLRVLNHRNSDDAYPFLISTELYPEWPLAKLSSTSDQLAREVVVALFSAPEYEFALPDAARFSWTIPMDYSDVHELMHELKIGPYMPDRTISLERLVAEYGRWLLVIIVTLLSLSLVTLYVLRVNRRMHESQLLLTGEVRERRDAERKLEEHKQLLEKRVEERTARLNHVNAELEADIAARIRVEKTLRDSEQTLRELNKIASVYPMPLEEKITALIEAGRSHFGFEYGTLYQRTDSGAEIMQRTGNQQGTKEPILDIDAREFDHMLHDEAMQMVQQPLPGMAETFSQDKESNCVAVKVVVEGQPYGFLCLADSGHSLRTLNKVDKDILQLLADWIGMEIARNQASDREQQHVSDLAHVSRLGTMGEMASGLAHELNQPLTAIANYIRGTLRRLHAGKMDDQELQSVLERSAKEAERAAEVIRRIRAFVSKDSSLREEIDINEPARQVARMVATELNANHISLVLDLEQFPGTVVADAIQIEQVLLNLVRNAIDALIEHRGDKREISITSKMNKSGNVAIEVADNADALSPADLSRIYDPFFTTREDGMGLGLSISKTIIEAHGGTMYTRLADGHTVAGFTLPLICT
jgi:signal transduction histidine kinase